MNNLNLADLTCEPIIAKKAQDAENIGVCQYSANQLLQSITPENMATGIQRLFNIRNYEDNFLTSWQDDYNNLNKLSEVITAILRDYSRYNSKFSYNKYGLSIIALVHYLSKDQQNRERDAEIDNNPLTDNGTYWSRGIKDTDLLSQRFNLWNVSMTNTTITLTSTTEFSDYLFTANQLKNGLKISFIPTQNGAGYNAGDGYTITIDGVSKKLFENEDETIAGTGGTILKNRLLQIYYNSNGDGGNGAFYVVENFPHPIYSNYRTRPYYEVYSNGMCRQWSSADPADQSSTYTTNKTFSFAIPYKNTNYLLYPVGFDVHQVGEQLVTLATTGFTTSSLSTPCGTRCWVAYGEVDLNQISNYI